MTEKNEVKLIITADGSSAMAGINQVKDATGRLATDTGGLVGQIKSHWMGMSAAIYAAYSVMSKAWNFAEIAAGYQESRTQLQGLAAQYNTTADQIIAGVKKASDGMISNNAAAQAAVSALSKGLSADQLVQIADASKTLADVMGMETEPAFQKIAEALEIGKEKTLKLAVGTLDLKDRYGSLVETWSEAEKTAQMFNLVMEKSKQIQAEMGDSTDGTKDAMETFKADIKDLSDTIGKYLIKAFLFTKAAIQGFKADMYAAAAGVSDFMSIASKITDGLGMTNASEVWAQTRDDLSAKSKELMQDGQKTFESAYEWGGKLDDKVKSIKSSMDSSAISAGKMDVQWKELLKVKQESLKEWEQWFEKLKSEHAQAIEIMKKKQEELFDIKKKTSDLLFNLDQTQRNPIQQYQEATQRLRDRESIAMALPPEQADLQKKEIQDIQQEWTKWTGQVEYNGNIFLTQQQAFARAREEVSRLGQTLETAAKGEYDKIEKQAADIAVAMSTAKEAMRDIRFIIDYIKAQNPTLKIDTTVAELKLKNLTASVNSLYKSLDKDYTPLAAPSTPSQMGRDIPTNSDNSNGASSKPFSTGVWNNYEVIRESIDSIPDVSYKEIVFDIYGTGSDKKPIMDKLKEIQGGYLGLPTAGKYTTSFVGGDGQPIMSSLSDIQRLMTFYRNEQYESAQRSAAQSGSNEGIFGAWGAYDKKVNSMFGNVFNALFSGQIGDGSGTGGTTGQVTDDSDTYHISFGDIIIQDITNPEQLAKEIVKPLQIELQRLAAIS